MNASRDFIRTIKALSKEISKIQNTLPLLTKVKSKGGRPKGSKNKVKADVDAPTATPTEPLVSDKVATDGNVATVQAPAALVASSA